MADYRYILLKDGIGETRDSENVFVGALRKLLSKQVNVSRGELLVPVDPNRVYQRNDGLPKQHYCLRRDNTIAIYCVEDDVAPLSHVDYKLLQAIESPTDRYATFSTENKLEWGENLKEGDQVYVRVPSAILSGATDWSLAVVCYKGPVEGLSGTNFGVEIEDAHYRGRGTTDGWFRSEYYFRCDKDCGLFVALDKLELVPVLPQDSQPSSTIHSNDRVVVYNKKGIPIHGIARWTGRNVGMKKKLDHLHIGIETDVTVYSCDVAECVVGIDHLFPAQRYHRLVVPASMVVKEEKAYGSRPPQKPLHGLVKQRSRQPIQHIYDTIPGDSPSVRRRLFEQGESVSIQGERAHKNISQKGSSQQSEDQQQVNDDIQQYNDDANQHPTYPASPHTVCDQSTVSERDGISTKKISSHGRTVVGESKRHSLHSIVQQYEQEMEEKVQQYQAQISALMSNNEQLHQQNTDQEEQHRTQLQERDDELLRVKEELSEVTEQLRKQVEQSDQLEEELKQSRNQFSDYKLQANEQQQQLSSELENSKEQVIQIQGQLDEAVDQRQRIEAEARNQLQQLLQEIESKNQKLREAREHSTQLEQQLEQKENQKQQVEGELREALEYSTQLQQQLREEEDQRQQLQARIDTAFAYIRGDPPTSQVGFDAIELWEVPREEIHISNTILGTGGWGYVAKGIFRGQDVAVKCLHRGILSQYSINHVRREISIMAQVRHPNLLLLIGAVLNVDTGPIIITELLDRTLRSAYEDNVLEEPTKLPVLRGVASALCYLHSHRRPIIHRDVNSANVLLEAMRNNSWKAKLSDFGSANLIRLATTPAEGAVPYSAPEVRHAEVRNQQTPKVDVYSFGVLLCEVSLCRFPPDPVDFPTMLEDVRTSQDRQVHTLASDCTKQSPDDRPAMDNVLTRIDALLQ